MNTLALIKKLRKDKGMTQLDVAEKLNMSQSAYLQIEKGATELTVSRLGQIAKILGVPLYSLMGVEDNREARIEVLSQQVGRAGVAVRLSLDTDKTLEEIISQRTFFWVESISIIHKMILTKGLELGCFDYKVYGSDLVLDYPSIIYKKAVANPSDPKFKTDVLSAFPKEAIKPVLDILFQNELFQLLARNIPFDVGLRTEEYERTRKKNAEVRK